MRVSSFSCCLICVVAASWIGDKNVVNAFGNRPQQPPTSTTSRTSPYQRWMTTTSNTALFSVAAPASLEAILFDCDGVLADTERDGHRISFNQAFRENGIDDEWDVERYGVLLEVGGGKERMTAHWNEVGWPAVFQSMTEPDRVAKVKELHLRKTDIFMDLIDQGKIPLRPGILRLVDDAIQNNIRLAVCSTSNDKAVSNLVRVLLGPDRAAHFQIFAGDVVRQKKPAPDIYQLAVDTMELDKSRCVIVEDSFIGLGAARAAGISCVVTKSSYTQNEDFTGADLVVEEIGDDPTTGVTLATLASLLKVNV